MMNLILNTIFKHQDILAATKFIESQQPQVPEGYKVFVEEDTGSCGFIFSNC